jgi:hypothetical protein
MMGGCGAIVSLSSADATPSELSRELSTEGVVQRKSNRINHIIQYIAPLPVSERRVFLFAVYIGQIRVDGGLLHHISLTYIVTRLMRKSYQKAISIQFEI